MKSIIPNPRIALITKIWFLVFAAFAMFVFLTTDASWRGLSFVLSLCLAVLFFARERIDDERVHSLKLKALSIGFMGGLALTFWGESQYRPLARPLSANDFMCITLLTALALFHFWRWQDGQADRKA